MALINDARGNTLTAQILSAANAVYRSLGGELREEVYGKALLLELEKRGLAVLRMGSLPPGPTQLSAAEDRPSAPLYLMLLVEDRVLIKIKARPRLPPQDDALTQFTGELQAAQKPIGLLLNFGRKSVYFKRIMQPKRLEGANSRV